MLQNRVDPTGSLIQTKARGAWLGNRGQLHGNGNTILRPYKHQAWIICQLQFKDRHREIMAPGLWTELFFLDEATALSAGHRPCFECRRDAATQFKAAWLLGNPTHGFAPNVKIGEIDKILQRERIDQHNDKIVFEADPRHLPDGVFVSVNGQPHLLAAGLIYPWTPFGYEKPATVPATALVLTPRSTINAILAGYRPQMTINY